MAALSAALITRDASCQQIHLSHGGTLHTAEGPSDPASDAPLAAPAPGSTVHSRPCRALAPCGPGCHPSRRSSPARRLQTDSTAATHSPAVPLVDAKCPH